VLVVGGAIIAPALCLRWVLWNSGTSAGQELHASVFVVKLYRDRTSCSRVEETLRLRHCRSIDRLIGGSKSSMVWVRAVLASDYFWSSVAASSMLFLIFGSQGWERVQASAVP
jgi:hypothetical protein